MFFVSGGGKGKALQHWLRGLTVLWTLAVAASPAHADSTFLLQLGTFDTEAQASQKWDDVKGKNADLVGSLTLHVAEVALPPDNTINYRTQAGPIASHDQAATLCSTLQTRGVECYVVETALFTGEQAATSAPAPAAVTQPSPAPEASPAPAVVAEAAPQTPPAAPITPLPVAEEAPALPPAPPAEPALTVTEPVVSPAPAPVPAPAADDSSAVAQAQAIAAGGRPVAEAPPAPPPPPPPPPAADSTPAPVLTEVAAAPAPAPVPAPAEAPVVAAEPAPALPPGDHVIPARAPHFLNAPAAAAPTQVPPPAPVADETAAPPPPPAEKPGFFSRLFGSSKPKPPAADTGNMQGEVSVAEAIRVPVGSGRHTKAVVPNLPAVHGLGGYASQNGQKAYWAQLSYFEDEDSARNFYEEFRAAYPQFSDGVRVRITRPYSSSSRAGHISLRVGPFAGTEDVNTICRAAGKRGLRCTVVRDMGSSSSLGSAVRTHAPSYGSNFDDRSRNAAAPGEPQAGAMFWVQLGSYRSPDDAWDTWKNLQEDNHKLLGRVHASVSNPPSSSSARAVFRLRAGPFVSETKAQSLCDGLSGSGTACIVIHDR